MTLRPNINRAIMYIYYWQKDTTAGQVRVKGKHISKQTGYN